MENNNENGSLRTSFKKVLGTFFCGRQYLLLVGRNIRAFEWEIEKAMKLVDDIIGLKKNETLALGTIILTKTNKCHLTETQIGNMNHSTQFYDLQDGQQRLTTICILLAAMRDAINAWGQKVEPLGDEGKEVMRIIEHLIAPPKRRSDLFARIEAHERDGGKFLNKLLFPQSSNGNENNSSESGPPTKKLKSTWMTPEERMKVVYDQIQERLSKMNPVQLGSLLDALHDRIILLVDEMVDENLCQANILNQRHSTDPEPVDYFKVMVCRSTDDKRDEETKRKMEEEWGKLCDANGRETVEEACFLLGQIAKGTLLSDGFRTEWKLTNLFQDFVKTSISEHGSAANVFKEVYSTTRKLFYFRQRKTELYDDYSDEDKARLVPSLRVLYTASTLRTDGTMIKALVVASMLLLNDNHTELVSYMQSLEPVALWMMVGKPRPNERVTRLSDILRELKALASGPDARGPAIELSLEEKRGIRNTLMTGVFNLSDNKVRGILERLNSQLHATQEAESMAVDGPRVADIGPYALAIQNDTVYLDTIFDLPGTKKHTLGNLVVTTKRKTRGTFQDFDAKRTRYVQDPRFSLTMEVGNTAYPPFPEIGNTDLWKAQTCNRNLASIMTAADELWGL